MGEVWRAVHRERGVPVAVKLMRPAAASRPDLVASFHREVRAAAGLNHPNIAPVLDAGELTADLWPQLGGGGRGSGAPQASGQASTGRFRAGSPYLVTELAFGSLAAAPPPASWREVKSIASELLSALAHAHARGVMHRDLKPGNVLLAAPVVSAVAGALPLDVGTMEGQKGARVLLADFGLAWTAKDGRSEGDTASGTPAYMAPEQLDGRWRDIGPWTDMYGLGCLVWWLVAGRTPHQPRNFEQALLHQHRMLPPLRPLFSTPSNLDSWLLRMVARDPGARFQSAADAAWALSSLADPELGAVEPPDPHIDSDITLPMRDRGQRRAVSSDAPPIVLPFLRRHPPIQTGWRGLCPSRGRIPPLSDGLALFGIRSPPFIGRDAVRDTLWAELNAVHRERRARAVVISGLPGSGKSRLAGWLTETAAELGVAEALHAGFREGAAGVTELVRSTLSCSGLSGEALNGRVETWLMRHGLQDPFATRALARLASAEGGGLGEREIFEALRALVSLLARSRPVILWLDDVHLSGQALALTEHLLATGGALPLLLVLTARVEPMDDPDRALRLQQLEAAPLVRRVPLGPLSVAHHRELVRALLPLDPDLSQRIEEKTSGNPGFATALIGALVQEHGLVDGATGLKLREGAPLVPDQLVEALSATLDPLFVGATREARDALTLASLFGGEVDRGTWEAACASAGLSVPEAQLQHLQSAGLIRQHIGVQPSFTFLYPPLQVYLEWLSAREGRLPALHRACAQVLIRARGTGSAARLGRHLFASGDAAEVMELLEQAEARLPSVACAEGIALLGLRERALAEAELPRHDPRWGQLWLQRARLLMAAAAPVEALQAAVRAEEAASRHGWREIEVDARILRGRAALRRGRLDLAEAILREVLAEEGESLNPASEMEARLALSLVKLHRGSPDESGAELDGIEQSPAARRLSAGHAELLGASIGAMRGGVALEAGRLDEARGAYRVAQRRHHALGAMGRLGEARCLAGLGTIARLEGLHARAERRLHQAISLSEIGGSGQALTFGVPMAILALQRGEPWRARMLAGRALEPLVRLGLDAEASLARLALGAAALQEGSDEAWERELAGVSPFFERNRWTSVDLRWLLDHAGRLRRGEAIPQRDHTTASSLR